MSNQNADANIDPLADLGLNLGDDTQTAVSETSEAVTNDGAEVVKTEGDAAAPETEAEKEKKTRVAVKVGEVEFEELDFVPSIKRGGGGGKGESKYDFDKLTAPAAREDGEGYRYSTFTVNNVEGQEFKALQRSVQSAATAQNREHKESGSKTRFITRTKVVDGEAVGVIVFRVDDTVDGE